MYNFDWKIHKRFLDLQMFADGDGGEVETPETHTDSELGAPKAERKYTDEDVNKILDKKFAEWQKKQEKKVSEAERLGKMSEAEKANERIRQLEERLAAADKEKAVAAMTKQARAILADKDIHVDDALLANLIADDAETTKASVESFVSLFKNAVDKAVKEALKGETPKTGGSSGLTADQIMKIPNRAERQQKIRENMHLFQNK